MEDAFSRRRKEDTPFEWKSLYHPSLKSLVGIKSWREEGQGNKTGNEHLECIDLAALLAVFMQVRFLLSALSDPTVQCL